MRLDRITTIRDHLIAIRDRKDDGLFEMGDWLTYDDGDTYFDVFNITDESKDVVKRAHKKHCGTRGCLAGWAVVLFPDAALDKEHSTISEVAGDILGLCPNDRHYMFLGEWAHDSRDEDHIPVEEITLDNAIDYLDKVIDQGTALVSIEIEDDWIY